MNDNEKMYDQWLSIVNVSPRPAGSKNEQKVRELIKKAVLNEECTYVSQFFPYESWELMHFSGLMQEHPVKEQIKAYPAVGSSSGQDIKGYVERIGYTNIWDMYLWPRYGVFNTEGAVIAYITSRPDGEALSQTLLEEWKYPHLITGRATFLKWEAALENGEDIYVSFSLQTKTVEKQDGENICISLPGRKENNLIIVGAHYDSMYNTRGAYDNASGVAILLELIRRLKSLDLKANVKIVFFGSEELLLAGSNAYVQSISNTERNTLSLFLNIDGVGRGKILERWSTIEAEQKLAYAKEQRKTLFPHSLVTVPPPPGSDHSPFVINGYDSIMLTINDQEIIHTFKDEPSEEIYNNMKRVVTYVQYILENYT
ncbi:M28 family metallopeptidase [Thalassobacillus sp. C254]|uniref:M28 family metallopeptidase n=1 Tax=Thalassobacillus sp. C254 TaxID=1225341 RepID=UPI0006D061FA|nr:M28 family metallopeptidase [Thalassobacillus sp. C254]